MKKNLWKNSILICIALLVGFSLNVYGEKDSDYIKSLHSLLKHTTPIVTVQELKKEMDWPKKLILLDTRRMQEFGVSHLKQARHVGYKAFKLDALDNVPRDAAIVVYCSLGVRSEAIGEKLLDAGYKNVRNLLGGMFEWVNQGYPVYDMTGSPTLRVHAYSKKWSRWLFKGEKVYK